jgi:salicylate hydroxylase
MSRKIIVIGGGIGGLTAALALLRRGLDVEVHEQAAGLKEVGAGIQTSANGTRVLHALGLSDALARVQVLPSRREIRHWSTGEAWSWFELGETSVKRYGTPHIMLHRGDLQMILAGAVRQLKPDAIRLGTTCVGVTQSEGQATVHTASGVTATAAFVIGADGIHSKVRESLFGADRPSSPAWWRGAGWWRWNAARKPEEMQGTNWLGPSGHVLHYPVRRGELMNYISFVERDDWQIESWTVAGTTAELANDYRGWHPDVHAIIRNIEVPFKWALMIRGPMERWSRGRITLLGDACHPTLPFLGQGAVMAIEDAYVSRLAWRNIDDPVAFARYEDIAATAPQRSCASRTEPAAGLQPRARRRAWSRPAARPAAGARQERSTGSTSMMRRRWSLTAQNDFSSSQAYSMRSRMIVRSNRACSLPASRFPHIVPSGMTLNVYLAGPHEKISPLSVMEPTKAACRAGA